QLPSVDAGLGADRWGLPGAVRRAWPVPPEGRRAARGRRVVARRGPRSLVAAASPVVNGVGRRRTWALPRFSPSTRRIADGRPGATRRTGARRGGRKGTPWWPSAAVRAG